MPEDMDPELPARKRAYTPGDEVMEWGKVLFRPDEWDEQYFPHVLAESPAKVRNPPLADISRVRFRLFPPSKRSGRLNASRLEV